MWKLFRSQILWRIRLLQNRFTNTNSLIENNNDIPINRFWYENWIELSNNLVRFIQRSFVEFCKTKRKMCPKARVSSYLQTIQETIELNACTQCYSTWQWNIEINFTLNMIAKFAKYAVQSTVNTLKRCKCNQYLFQYCRCFDNWHGWFVFLCLTVSTVLAIVCRKEQCGSLFSSSCIATFNGLDSFASSCILIVYQ